MNRNVNRKTTRECRGKSLARQNAGSRASSVFTFSRRGRRQSMTQRSNYYLRERVIASRVAVQIRQHCSPFWSLIPDFRLSRQSRLLPRCTLSRRKTNENEGKSVEAKPERLLSVDTRTFRVRRGTIRRFITHNTRHKSVGRLNKNHVVSVARADTCFIGGVLVASAVDRGFTSSSGSPKEVSPRMEVYFEDYSDA